MNVGNFDEKLIKNVLDEINRLKSQLEDLETYKDELPEDEINSIRKETLEQLINNTKILEKMKAGDITTKTKLDEARMKINALLCENYNVKELLNSYLVTESNFLREKLNRVIREFNLNKINGVEYQTAVSQILEALAKVTGLNENEKNLYNNIKNNVMNKYEVDQGINQNKIEKSLKK
jgi:hypothetical protein